MFGTMNCTYETPCGWCTKWNKKCDCNVGCDLSEIKILIKDCLVPESVISEIVETVMSYEKDLDNMRNIFKRKDFALEYIKSGRLPPL